MDSRDSRRPVICRGPAREEPVVGTLASQRDRGAPEDKRPSERAGQAHLRDGIWVDLDGRSLPWGQTSNLWAWACRGPEL